MQRRSRRWLPWVVAALALLLTGLLHRSFEVDTSPAPRASGQSGCTLGPDRRGARPLPTGSLPSSGTAKLTVVAPSPTPAPVREPAEPEPEPGPRLTDVPLPVASLPVKDGPPTGPGVLLLGITEDAAHHVVAWQEGAPPLRVLTSPEPLADLAWSSGKLLAASAGAEPGVRTWRSSGAGWTADTETLPGAWTLHRIAGVVLASGEAGVRLHTAAGWTSLPVGGRVAAEGRALAAGGPRGTGLLVQVDGSDGVALLACDVPDRRCERTWLLGPGTGCGITGPRAAAALRRHAGTLLAHPLRSGVPQGPERRDATRRCPRWLEHPVLGSLSLAAEGPLGVDVPHARATLHDTRARGEPDLFGAVGATLLRVAPGTDRAAEPVLRFRPPAEITCVRPGPP